MIHDYNNTTDPLSDTIYLGSDRLDIALLVQFMIIYILYDTVRK